MDFTSTPGHSVETDKNISFPEGIPGFEEFKEYQLLSKENDNRLLWLAANQEPELEFACTTPDNLGVNYELSLSDDELEMLKYEENNQLAVLVTLIEGSDDAPGVYGNFLGPIVINIDSKIGFQKVLTNAEGTITIRS